MRQYDWYSDNDVQRVLLPLDAESREMLNELVSHLYPTHNGTQKNKQRGKVAEMAIRMLYQRTLAQRAQQ